MNPDNVKRKQHSIGKWYTRKEWEKDHKPTCNFYPCPQWSELHWHVGCTHKTNRWDICKHCRQKLTPTQS